jgi:uncharacterized protein YciI
MWILELAFDPPDHPERLARRPAHRELLKQFHAEGVVPYAGPMADGRTGLVLWDLPDEAGVREYMARDPYYGTAGVTVASLRQWDTLPL